MILFQWRRHSIKNPNNRVSSQILRCALILVQITKIITFYPKNFYKGTFQFECVFHDLANEKKSKPFAFRTMEGDTGL